MRYDVIVTGGGPAGCLAAHDLAAGGARVLVLEASQADGAGAESAVLMRRGRALLPFDLGRVAQREVIRGVRVCGTAPGGEGVRVLTHRGILTSPLLVAAGGAPRPLDGNLKAGCRGRQARVLSVDIPCPLGWLRHGAASFEFGLIPRGFGWIVPGLDRVTVRLTVHGPLATPPQAILERLLTPRHLPRPHDVDWAFRPLPLFHPASPSPVGDRTLPVGDAAGVVDPLVGEGFSGAIQSGRLAARAILNHGGDPVRASAEYAASMRGGLGEELGTGYRLARLLQANPTFWHRIFAERPALLARCLDVLAGRASYGRFARLLKREAGEVLRDRDGSPLAAVFLGEWAARTEGGR